MTNGRPPFGDKEELKPVPDPTVLTTQALLREIAGLREVLEIRIEALTRDAHDKFGACQATFKQVERQFQQVESQRVEQKADMKAAVDAALVSLKETTTKSEDAITRQLEQIVATFKAETSSLRRSIDDNKDRIVEVEQQVVRAGGEKIGAKEDRTGLYAGLAAIAGIAAIAAVIISLVAGS
jgi:flagellar biosynthesis chaperone FliJ